MGLSHGTVRCLPSRDSRLFVAQSLTRSESKRRLLGRYDIAEVNPVFLSSSSRLGGHNRPMKIMDPVQPTKYHGRRKVEALRTRDRKECTVHPIKTANHAWKTKRSVSSCRRSIKPSCTLKSARCSHGQSRGGEKSLGGRVEKWHPCRLID